LKKLLQLLAVSAGGGLLLGAGFRLAERRLTGIAEASEDPDGTISSFRERLEDLERRLDLKNTAASGSASGRLANPHEGLQAELAEQMRGMEERLRLDLGHLSEGRINSLSDALEKRIEQRLAPLETEPASQRASVDELREYSLRTEKSLQKLLEGVDRLVAAQTSKVAGPVAP
jgi:uncharacterized coiled-coil protein SlyX